MGDTGRVDDAEFAYRGNRWGMPEEGPGSVPGVGRRLVAVLLDWLLCLAATFLVTGADPADPAAAGAVAEPTLGVFAAYNVVLLSLIGTTVGKRLVGIGLVSTGERPVPWAVAMLIRTVLLCLVVPAVVYDRDQRGLHDRAAGTISRRF
jgi:uncharacterized RDD family membrane protein YckC